MRSTFKKKKKQAEVVAATAANIPPSEEAFVLFPKFPVELQVEIFKHNIPEPQILTVQFRPPASRRGHARFSTHTKPSPLLITCKASRAAILMVYKACIEMGDSDRKIRFDGVNDTIHLAPAENAVTYGEDGESNIPRFVIPKYLPRGFKGVEKVLLYTGIGPFRGGSSVWNWNMGKNELERAFSVARHFEKLKNLQITHMPDNNLEVVSSHPVMWDQGFIRDMDGSDGYVEDCNRLESKEKAAEELYGQKLKAFKLSQAVPSIEIVSIHGFRRPSPPPVLEEGEEGDK